MTLDADRLYATLPAAMRTRDTAEGGVVRALFALIAEQGDRVARDIDRLGESWFIETCPDWAIPYIGDLLDVRALLPVTGSSARAWVADTIHLRRRKGTLSVLARLARDTTGWPTVAAEMFRRLATTQQLNHVRLAAPAWATVRDRDAMARVEGAFDTAPHRLDIRSIAKRQGRYNVPNIALFQARLQAYPLAEAEALRVGPGRFRCDPAGRDLPLFNPPQTAAGDTLADVNLPLPLDRLPLWRELEARRQALAEGRTPAARFFGDNPPFRLFVQPTAADAFAELAPEEIAVCDLHDVADPRGWRRPPASIGYTLPGGGIVQRIIRAGIDPVRGRIAFPDGVDPAGVRVSCAHAAPGDLGGGPYDRREDLARVIDRRIGWQVGVSRRRAAVPGKIFATVGEAIAEWNAQPAGTAGVIALLDNDILAEELTGAKAVIVAEASLLVLTSADWPATPRAGGGEDLLPGTLAPQGLRATIAGSIEARGTAPADSASPGALVIEGVLVTGKLTVTVDGTANLGRLALSHMTLLPDGSGLAVAGEHGRLTVEITRSLVGPIQLSDTVPGLAISESIQIGAAGIAARGARATLDGATVFGPAKLLAVTASDTLFLGGVTATRKQIGCLRFSWVPPGSDGPRRFRCQPELAITAAGAGADKPAITARLTPMFDSATPGDAAFARLALACAREIREGGEAGGAMGAWRFLEEPQRLANLDIGLGEYLGIGLEAGSIALT